MKSTKARNYHCFLFHYFYPNPFVSVPSPSNSWTHIFFTKAILSLLYIHKSLWTNIPLPCIFLITATHRLLVTCSVVILPSIILPHACTIYISIFIFWYTKAGPLLCYKLCFRYVVVQSWDDDVAQKKTGPEFFFNSNFSIYFLLFFFPFFYQHCNHIGILTYLLSSKTFYSDLVLAFYKMHVLYHWYFPSLDFKT